MRRGYSQDVRAEAITRRYHGMEWKQIQVGIQEKFHVKPSIRQMQKWFEDYQGTGEDPTGVKFMATAIKEAAERARPLAYSEVMEGLPALRSFIELGADLEDAGWMFVLLALERQVGRDNFDRIVAKYVQLRDRLNEEKGGQR
ncbi:hypothetical protein ES703_22836 [subsurface metagenome]